MRRRQEFRGRKRVIRFAKATGILFAWHCLMVILYLSGRVRDERYYSDNALLAS